MKRRIIAVILGLALALSLTGCVSQSDYDELKAELESALSEVEVLEAEIQSKNADIKRQKAEIENVSAYIDEEAQIKSVKDELGDVITENVSVSITHLTNGDTALRLCVAIGYDAAQTGAIDEFQNLLPVIGDSITSGGIVTDYNYVIGEIWTPTGIYGVFSVDTRTQDVRVLMDND